MLAEALDRFGLWDHLPVEQRRAAFADVATGCYPLDFDLLYEQVEFCADGENLSEGGVERFLASLAPALVRHGVSLQVEPVEFSAPDVGDYVVSINGLRCVVWRGVECQDGSDTWTMATTRPLAVVNQLLEDAAASPVRAHTLYAGGNDGLVLLLNPGIAEAMRASGLFPDHEVPALAKGDVPS
ncbi:hypothetical protein GCM10009839_12390 [Catenulispora yoronensis]|uniref:Uncharacterized protein n=1 Tax=Catenulispora yoronensis TaxID=450799 RepID=A0ABP5F8M9_9ACTN